MGKVAVEHIFNGATGTSYDSTRTTLGKWITQTTLQDTTSWAGPVPIAINRFCEGINGITYGTGVYALNYDSTYDLVFVGDNTTAAATRKVHAFFYDKTKYNLEYLGFITLSTSGAGNKTMTGLAASRHLYSTGTVTVSGTGVTGNGTAWQTARYSTGARIGFGSTDPAQITTWYEIATITSDTAIVLNGASLTAYGAGTAYVIDEIRIVTSITSATAAEGGLYLVKGVNVLAFSPTGTTFSLAVATDNVRAVYLVQDNASATVTAGIGIGLKPIASNTDHTVYFLNADGASSVRVHKFNIRAALTIASGITTTPFVFKTNAMSTTTTVNTLTFNAEYATPTNQAQRNVASLFFADIGNVYQVQESDLASLSNFTLNSWAESPPGSGAGATFVSSGALRNIKYDSTGEYFLITTNTPYRDYASTFKSGTTAADRIWNANTLQQDQILSAVAGVQDHPKKVFPNLIASLDGMCYIIQQSQSIVTNDLYAVPLGADWMTATGANTSRYPRLITPSIATPNAYKLISVYINKALILGSDNLGIVPEPIRVYVRTSGISDNTGNWLSVSASGDLTGVGGLTTTTEVQFMFEFRAFGLAPVTGRIYSVCVTYEDTSTDSHYIPCADLSSLTNKEFVYKFAYKFHSTVPTLRIRLYNAATNALIVDDNTSTPTGTFEKSTASTPSWVAWTDADKTNETTYLRYTPSTSDKTAIEGLNIRAWLSLA